MSEPKDCPKNEQLAEKRGSRATVKFFSQGHYPPIYQQARKGVYLFFSIIAQVIIEKRAH